MSKCKQLHQQDKKADSLNQNLYISRIKKVQNICIKRKKADKEAMNIYKNSSLNIVDIDKESTRELIRY